LGSCFVIQPFDHAVYDKRYQDVFDPAIRAAGLTPYRVDRDPSASVPIESIEDGIRAADICFAEITSNNPNVWYELGFALALQKPVLLVCTNERERFPFDIQHRHVIRYQTESPSDFETLRDDITARLTAALKSRETLAEMSQTTVVADVAGLTQEQLAALALVAQRSGIAGDGLTPHELTQQMGSVGFTQLATTLSVRGLSRLGLVELFYEANFNGENYPALRVTENGLDWLERNKELLLLRRDSPPSQPFPPSRQDDDLDDLPF
jgi:nucleoside 2-deoxyribosyltransferase